MTASEISKITGIRSGMVATYARRGLLNQRRWSMNVVGEERKVYKGANKYMLFSEEEGYLGKYSAREMSEKLGIHSETIYKSERERLLMHRKYEVVKEKDMDKFMESFCKTMEQVHRELNGRDLRFKMEK